MKLPKTLPAPALPSNLSSNAKWLAGEGAGSWFVIEPTSNAHRYVVKRFSPIGKLECESIFTSNDEFDLSRAYAISYPAHCLKVTVIQQGKRIVLTNEEG